LQKIVSKVFTKKSTKNPKPFFLDCFITFFGVSRREELKNTKKSRLKNLVSPGTFLAAEEPTNHVEVRHRSSPLFLFMALKKNPHRGGTQPGERMPG
jgi:hypothetical protein